MKITLGFSPCPNDTFIFDALVHRRIDMEDLEFDYVIADVEELNQKALSGVIDVTKISIHAYAYVAGDYLLSDSGSALGFGNGPLVVCRKKIDPCELDNLRIAIPGRFTTANLLFSIAWPHATDKKEYLFSDIEDILLREEADAGIIIHETRFSYREKGLQKIADLGEYWEKLTGLPVPLGSIAINRKIAPENVIKINRLIRRSVEYAIENPDASYDFVMSNARDLERNVVEKHIRLYVNDYTLSLGVEGRKTIEGLFRIAAEKMVIPAIPEKIFIT